MIMRHRSLRKSAPATFSAPEVLEPVRRTPVHWSRLRPCAQLASVGTNHPQYPVNRNARGSVMAVIHVVAAPRREGDPDWPPLSGPGGMLV
jgi:hypothetical protein